MSQCKQAHLSMAGQCRLWNRVLMPTRPWQVTRRHIIPTQDSRPRPALGRESLASLLTQAAGGRGQPGQLPHPAALLQRGNEEGAMGN